MKCERCGETLKPGHTHVCGSGDDPAPEGERAPVEVTLDAEGLRVRVNDPDVIFGALESFASGLFAPKRIGSQRIGRRRKR